MLLLCIHSHWAVTSLLLLLLLLVRFRVVVVDGRPSVASSRARCNVQRSADY